MKKEKKRMKKAACVLLCMMLSCGAASTEVPAAQTMSTSYVSYTKPIFEVIKIPKILEKSSFFACVESKCVI